MHAPMSGRTAYDRIMRRTNIEIDDELLGKAAALTGLQTKRQVVHRALELLVKAEERKEILRCFGSGIWKGNLEALRRNRV